MLNFHVTLMLRQLFQKKISFLLSALLWFLIISLYSIAAISSLLLVIIKYLM
jgi:hypothetical protein